MTPCVLMIFSAMNNEQISQEIVLKISNDDNHAKSISKIHEKGNFFVVT